MRTTLRGGRRPAPRPRHPCGYAYPRV